MTYAEKLKHPKWQKKRTEILQRDGFCCRECGSAEKTLHVHHCHYIKGEPWDTPSKFLLTLCEECHERRGESEHDIKLIFAATLASMPVGAIEEMISTHQTSAMEGFRREGLYWMREAGKGAEVTAFYNRLIASDDRSGEE